MKKLIFIATLLIAFIVIPSLVFTDKYKEKIKSIKPNPTQITKLPSDSIENHHFTIENDSLNSVPANNIHDDWENSDQFEMEFRSCG